MNYPLTLDMDLTNYNLEDLVSRDRGLMVAQALLGILNILCLGPKEKGSPLPLWIGRI